MAWKEFFEGFKSALPVVLGYLPIGFTFGLLGMEAGLTQLETVLMSCLVYAGSAQFIAVSMLSLGATPWAIIFTTFFVNFRHFLMSTALLPHFKNFSNGLVPLLAYGITDETFVVASAHYSEHQSSQWHLLGLNLTSHLAWVIFTWLGASTGKLITSPSDWGLDFALPALFIALLILTLKNKSTYVVAGLTGIIVLVFSIYLPGNWGVLLAAIIGATGGVISEKWIAE